MYLILFIIYFNRQATTTQSFLEEPDDVTVNLRDNVTLPGKVSTRRGVVQCTRDDFGLGADRQLSGFSRYKIIPWKLTKLH